MPIPSGLGMRGTARYRGEEQRVYTFRLEVILLLSQCYITFRQMLYYFRVNVILLFGKSYITFLRSLLEPLTKAL